MTLDRIIAITRRKDVNEVNGDPQPRESQVDRFYKKWGRDWYKFWYQNISVRGLPDKDDPRYVEEDSSE